MAYKRRNREFEARIAMLADARQITKRPAPSESLWQSIKDYFKAWVGRHIVADYPYYDQENM